MHKIDPEKANLCHVTRSVLALVVSLGSYVLQAQESTAQDTVVARKEILPEVHQSLSTDRRDGVTYVELETALKHVYTGAVPQSLEELKAHELQQTKVAAAIEKVTVNVRQGAAQGSGVLIRGGFVFTAAHVGGKPHRKATVVLSDGTELKAEVLGMNRNVDAGLLRIVDQAKRDSLPYASLGSSGSLKAGHWVIGAGHPGGWQAGRGAVIRVGRVLNVMSDTIMSDVALIGGDSGGPLFDLRGRLVGIHSRIGTEVVDNMHVPIDTFQRDWDRLTKAEAWGVLPGYKPMIGVAGKEGDPRAVLGEIVKGSPADQAYLMKGDVVQKFDGQVIETFDELQKAVRATMPGDRVRIEVLRGKQVLNLRIVIGVSED